MPNEGGWDDTTQGRARHLSSNLSIPQPMPATSRSRDNNIDHLEGEEERVWGESRTQTGGTDPLEDAPVSLKPGGNRSDTNPFLRKKVSEPQEEAPTGSFSRLGLNDTNNNPWQPALVSKNQLPPPPADHISPSLLDDRERDAWTPGSQQVGSVSPALVSLPSGRESPSWGEAALGERDKAPAPPMKLSEELTEDTHVWDDIDGSGKGKARAVGPTESASFGEWNLIDAGPTTDNNMSEADRPLLPPRQPTEPSSWKLSRQPIDGKSETYQVKNVRWVDADASGNPRTSPILVQNANGPCPLVALVNALTLTTPADVQDTALVQVLRSREQVSLNLLLDAVFDELMSPRRTNSEDALPDVSDLYAFLQSLHTGMNVNPRFIPTVSMVNAYKRTSLTHLHPTERGDLIPGTFENTAEMSLYATFSIPLIHGWLPPKSEPAYESLERQAPSYEDAQNLLFREEELNGKLSDSEPGLTESEQQLYQDVMLIKEFLNVSATQLTPWGIEVISKAIRPGTFAILFRNDHFSTLYCHPHTMQLLTLVTDTGYRTHDEIVWETLSDVNGELTEFLSGDFRVVGSGGAASSISADAYSHDGGEWTTVQTKRGKSRQDEETLASPSTEQEDRDLALALQLQEEEEERHRADEARRRRESLLSEQFIEQQAQQPTPVNRSGRGTRGGPRGGSVTRGRGGFVPGRSSSQSAPTTNTTHAQARPAQQVVRSLIPPQRQGVTRAADEGAEDAPPSYEQSAHDVAYQPPAGHPGHANSTSDLSRQSTRASTNPLPTGQRFPGQPAGGRLPMSPGGAMSGNGSGQAPSRERDCVVM